MAGFAKERIGVIAAGYVVIAGHASGARNAGFGGQIDHIRALGQRGHGRHARRVDRPAIGFGQGGESVQVAVPDARSAKVDVGGNCVLTRIQLRPAF